jgi:hypothetical protein
MTNDQLKAGLFGTWSLDQPLYFVLVFDRVDNSPVGKAGNGKRESHESKKQR